MAERFVCPLCGSDSLCKRLPGERNGYIELECGTYHVKYALDDGILYMKDDHEKRDRLLDLTVEVLVHHPFCTVNATKSHWYFFYNPDYTITERDYPNYINLSDRLGNYPDSLMDRISRGLLNLSYFFPGYGDYVEINENRKRLIFERNNNSIGLNDLTDFYLELGYFKKERVIDKIYTITAQGWQKIEELKKKELTLKQGFIAMQFGDDTKTIREAFRRAIKESGYSERFIDEKEHNHQIVPEIFFEIGRSLFLVVDITFPNYGAYYEAGYAQALGKEVIICCKKDIFDSKDKKDRPHFDIAQKSMIVWSDEEDLVKRLKRRIEATII